MRFLERRFGKSLSILDEEEEEEEEEEEKDEGTKEKGESQQQRQRRRFRVSGFTPSDPSWRSGPVSLLGTIDLSRYPAPGSFSLFAEVESAGEEEGGGANGGVAAARLTLALRRAAKTASVAEGQGGGGGGEQILRSLVRLADSRGGELSAAAAFSLSDGDDDGTESDEEEEEEDEEDDESSSGGSSDTDSTESDSDSESEDEAAAAAAPSSNFSQGAGGGSGARFALSLSSLRLDGVDALSPAALSLELSCLRCCSAAVLPSVSLASSDGAGPSAASSSSSSSSSPPLLKECGTCRAPLAASLQPRVAHASSSVVAVARCSGCVPRGVLLPLSSFGAQCERCSRVAALRGATATTATANAPSSSGGGGGSARFALRRPCPSCHASLAVLFEEFSFERMPEAGIRGGGRGGGSGGVGGTGTRIRKNRKGGGGGGAAAGDDDDDGDGKKAGSKSGSPLPRLGACDHYPHSHRAMRFPCCFRVFPCDVCHELSAASDSKHPPEVASVATRMVCGFCSKEQAFEKKGEPAVCRQCGKHLAGSSRFGVHGSGTRHWVRFSFFFLFSFLS